MRASLFAIAALTLFFAFSNAHAGTAFLQGEETVGMTKTCYYDYLGSTYTKTVSSVALCPLSIAVKSPPSRPGYGSRPAQPAYGTAFKTGEVARGMTKVCYYDYLGSQYTKTVSSVALCPLSIKVRLN